MDATLSSDANVNLMGGGANDKPLYPLFSNGKFEVVYKIMIIRIKFIYTALI